MYVGPGVYQGIEAGVRDCSHGKSYELESKLLKGGLYRGLYRVYIGIMENKILGFGI